MKHTAIELTEVTKDYGGARGVRDVNLTVEAGTIFGFLGPNGAGKSTTINMLLDFIRPTSGQVKLFGLSAQEKSVEIHRRIGFLAGDMAMDRGLTGWQQLEYLGNLHGEFDRSYVTELAERLACRLDRKFKTLSRGNKQKVGLIAALMHKPDLLILDEPTSGLDPLIQAEFNKIILEHKNAGGTAFISSHIISEVQEICDHVAFIREGRIVATRPIADITRESPKEVTVITKSKELQTKLKKLPGLTITDTSHDVLHGTFSGDINKLIQLLSGYTVDGFSISEAELEAAFMKYYEDEK